MTHAEGRIGERGAVRPVGLHGVELDLERWFPITIADDGSLRIDQYGLSTPGIHKFGANGDISSGSVPEDIWDGGGLYTGFIASAVACEILSNDANDDAGDTGARTVEVQGLDALGNIQIVTATMDGVNPVAIGTFLRIYRMFVKSAGTSEGNEGTITARTVAGAVAMAQISPLIGQTLMAVYTIPNDFNSANMVQLIIGIRATTAQAVSATVALQARPDGEAWQTKEYLDVHSYGNVAIIDFRHAPGYAPLTDLRLRVLAVSGNNIVISGGFDLKFVERIMA